MQKAPEYYGKTKLVYCNCASCGTLLLGDSLEEWFLTKSWDVLRNLGIPHPVTGRVSGRPYCLQCWSFADRMSSGANK